MIRNAQKKLNPIHGDCGDEYRNPPYLTASGDLSHHIEKVPEPYDINIITKDRKQETSNTQWEEYAGYSRAVKFKHPIK